MNLQLEFEPKGITEKLGDKLGFFSKRTEGDLKRFNEFM